MANCLRFLPALPALAVAAGPVFASDTDWPSYGSDAASTKYAPLEQIHAGNVHRLATAWSWASPDNPLGMFPGPFKSTPIKVGDTLFVSTSLGHVAAIDAVTGRQRWAFDTGSWRGGKPANLGFNHRGVAYWEGERGHRVLMPTNDGFLWSLDASTGEPDPDFGVNGRVDLSKGLGRDVQRRMYSVISPPLVVGDLAIVGSVIADEWSMPRLTDYPRGDVRAFDVRTGELRWTFHSIPRPGDTGHESWLDDSWQDAGAVNVWTLMSADHDLGYVYLPSERLRTTGTVGTVPATTCSRTAWSALKRRPASSSGTSRPCTTGFGTTTCRRRRTWSTSPSTGGRSRRWRRSPSRGSCSCSTGSPASRSGPSRNARCRRARCRASARPPRSRSRRGPRRSNTKAPRSTILSTTRPRSAPRHSPSSPSSTTGRSTRHRA